MFLLGMAVQACTVIPRSNRATPKVYTVTPKMNTVIPNLYTATPKIAQPFLEAT